MVAVALTVALLLQAAPATRGVVAGQIQIRQGSPAAAVRVSAIPAPPPDARPEEGIQYYEQRPPVSTALSNAQGRYRLANIPPGRYLIIASMLGSATYYPGATEYFKAGVVTVAAGATVDNIDFTLLLPVGGRVSGRVTPPPPRDINERAVLSGLKLQELVEMPVSADGTFEFGYVPKGTYLLSLYPTPPGMPSRVFEVGDRDVTTLEFTRPPVHTVSGRIVVQNGPLPNGSIAFATPQSYVPATISPDGMFTVRLQAARHRVEVAGMPVGYSLASVRVGATDATQGVTVNTSDISDVVITVAAPRRLPRVRGQITGIPAERLSSARAQLSGPIVGTLEVAVQKDGTFVFGAVTPGVYTLKVPQLPQLAAANVVVVGNDIEVPVTLSAR